MKSLARAANIGILIGIVAATAAAQVPPEIAAQLRQIGTGVCVPETAKIYAPLQQHAPYAGVTVVRDISYAQDPRTIMDVFAPEKGGGNRPVLIYVSGGGGDKKVNGPDGDAFYDNIMLWALKNGMTGVNMQRRGGLGGGGTGVGRTGERCGPRGRLGADEHQDVQGQPEPHFYLVRFRRQRAGEHLCRTSRNPGRERSGGEGCDPDVSAEFQYPSRNCAGRCSRRHSRYERPRSAQHDVRPSCR